MSNGKSIRVQTSGATLPGFLTSTSALIALAALGATVSQQAYALPTGGNVTAGSANISNTSNTTTINQNSEKAVINWTGFNTTSSQSVKFKQPDSSAIALNIISGGATTFNGSLTANGKVWLINTNGFLFGSGSTITVGSLLVSTANVSNPDGSGFYHNTSGKYTFNKPGNSEAAIVIDDAEITATGEVRSRSLLHPQGGDIILQAPAVSISGHSKLKTQNSDRNAAKNGSIIVASGDTFDFDGDGLITYGTNYHIDSSSTFNAKSRHSPLPHGDESALYVGDRSSITADGRITFAADVKDAVLDHVINLGGQYTDYPIYNRHANYNIRTNPEHVKLSEGDPTPTAYAVILGGHHHHHHHHHTPSPAPSPSPSPSPTPAPQSQNDVDFDDTHIIKPLTRPLESLGDESVEDTTVDPNISNVTYERPYLISLSTSFADGKLTLASGGGGNLGGISPAAGGDGASGSHDGGNTGVKCANAYLDNDWGKAPGQKSTCK